VLISDTGGRFGEPRIVFVNESFKRMSGLSDAEIVGHSLGSLRASILQEKEFSLLEHSYSDSRSATMETVRWRDDGSKVHCQWHISPVREETGRVTHYISILSDTTRLREHEENQRRNHEELVAVHQQLVENQQQLIQSEKMAFLGQLAAGVAHEINNPLGYVMSNLEVLSEDFEELLEELRAATGEQDSAKVEEAAEILRESIAGLDRLADIVQRLKNFARPADETLEEADLNHEVEEALKIVWNEIKHKCTVNKRLGELPLLRCRPGQLNQVFTNLLANAAQASPAQGEITVETEFTGTEIVVRVADMGKGISEENIPRLFTPFFTTKPAGEGTGLGLSVSYGIVQKHNGTIDVESEPGHGSTFTVRLPAEVSET
jgi:PAS domain S-box-containing protein